MRTSICQLLRVNVDETCKGTEGIVDLWYYFYEGNRDAELLAAQIGIMSPDEHIRYQRFQFETGRRLFAATRALVRTVLSRYASAEPADWRFAANDHGKPYILFPSVTPPIHFNLSNTPGLVVCAVSVAHERVGIDVERIDRGCKAIEIANEYFSPSELHAMRALPQAEQSLRFLTFWTLKESYIKARGLGLTLPLDQFRFSVDSDAVSIAFDARLAEDPTRWQFAILDASPDYMIAVGVDTGSAPLSLRAMPIVPLQTIRH